MKTILCGALALGALGSLASAKGVEAKSTWLGLDEELHSLSSNLSLQTPAGPQVGGIVKAVLTSSGDAPFDGDPDDVLGFSLYNARLWAQGNFGDIGWRVSFDFGGEVEGDVLTGGPFDANLLDAYATWSFGEAFMVTWGQYLFPMLMSTSDSPTDLLFINRTRLGQAFYGWDLGAMASGDYNQLRWYLGVQNGADSLNDEFRFAGRVEFDLGNGARRGPGRRPTASNRNLDATIGVFGMMDDSGLPLTTPGSGDGDVTAFGADFRLAMGAFTIGGEIANVDDGGLLIGGGGAVPFTDIAFFDNTPWAVYAAFQIVPDQWEIGVRWEDIDDEDSTNILTAGVNWYPSVNTPAKWQLNYIMIDSDDAALDGNAIQLGLVVGFNS
jgi:hypothetical protein